jgi:hypothetical protein
VKPAIYLLATFALAILAAVAVEVLRTERQYRAWRRREPWWLG